MSKEKAIRVVVWSGKTSDYEGWSEKHLTKAEHKGYCKLLLCKKDWEGFDEVPTEKEVEDIESKVSKEEADKKIIKLDRLNKQAFMDLVPSINTTTTNGRTAFRLVEKCKTSEYPERNSKIVWERLRAKYAPRNTSRLLNLKKLYENSKLERTEIDPGDWISFLEG